MDARDMLSRWLFVSTCSAHVSASLYNSNKSNFEQRLETNGTRNSVSGSSTAIVVRIVIGLRYTQRRDLDNDNDPTWLFLVSPVNNPSLVGLSVLFIVRVVSSRRCNTYTLMLTSRSVARIVSNRIVVLFCLVVLFMRFAIDV